VEKRPFNDEDERDKRAGHRRANELGKASIVQQRRPSLAHTNKGL